MDFIAILSLFVLACFVGCYVVWSATSALPITVKVSRKADPQALLRTLAENVLTRR